MKLRYLIALFLISVGTLVGLVKYYDIDPSLLTSLSFYEDIANPSIRVIRIEPGLRKEQIAEIMTSKLDWSPAEEDQFTNIHLALNTDDLEGHYFPKTYLLEKDEDPTGVTAAMLHEFGVETSKIKKPKSTSILNDETALKIASIIQREAAGNGDMKLISGIIWNRLFSGMRLQIDATLQYAKGTEADGWWGEVSPSDKSIDSSYNTYLHSGLPPSAIANPGLAALDAAYNPQKTSCLYYMHDKNRKIHCATTYAQHKANIDKYY